MSDMKEIMGAMRTAGSEPSKPCNTEDEQHDFQHVLHADGRDSYSNLFRCRNCGEYVKITHQRDKSDPYTAVWRED